ncbi:MAG: hypothetical protein LUH11_04045 [Candidatus Gastranaerophilales bacterium]|nr:hypothetical protein [Candidatus Gastranaerophilales bacterium]
MKEKIKLTEILYDLEFQYLINEDDSLSLLDLQGANLADIESETFEINENLAMILVDRLDNYIYDYYLNGYIDTLINECNEDVKDSNYEDILAKMKMYPEKFKGCLNLMEAFVNPNLFDISEIIESSKITKRCFQCNTRLIKSIVNGCTYYCYNCNEDFYE